jgi:hypothetical protein
MKMWANAYLEQARSDWDTREVVSENGCAACHELHYLQMATEKLGKAALLKSGNPLDSVVGSHKAFVRFLRVAAKNPSLRQRFRYSARQLQEHMKAIEPIADQIERLAPALSREGPNAEYPWETPRKEVVAPVSHAFPIVDELRDPKGRQLLKFISIMIREFDVFF